jgi:hypothetical protein
MNIRIEVRGWVKAVDWDTEGTLTFSNDISQQQAEQALRRFWNRVDTALYGNAAKRYGKRCQRLNVIEGDGIASRYHFHIAAKRPSERFATITAFADFLRKQWLADNPNNFVVSFAPIRDVERYTNYITKNVQRGHCDALILDSSHISAAS